jgi:hypothetical protein
MAKCDEQRRANGPPPEDLTVVFKSLNPLAQSADDAPDFVRLVDDDEQEAAPIRGITHNDRELCAVYDSNCFPAPQMLYLTKRGRSFILPGQADIREPLIFPMIFTHGERVWGINQPHNPMYATAERNM